MMRSKSRRLRWQAALTGLLAWLLCSCQPSAPIWGPGYSGFEGHGSIRQGFSANEAKPDPTICDIAHDIDELEERIDKFGSVVPKHADVWGQARLTMHRQEFERVMRADVYAFQQSIQATISASDQAFLANAMSLSAGTKLASSPTAADSVSLISGVNDAATRNQLVNHNTISNYVTPQGKLALEPSLIEDQKKRYLDHLHQLRRINEGDDNTDAPGYALNLLRIPVSLLTGECTQTGYGAECTITATLHMPDDLLPVTFRNLVVNDLVKLLTLPLTRIIETFPEEKLQEILVEYEAARREQKEKERNATAAQGIDEVVNARRKTSNIQSSIYSSLAENIGKSTPVSPHRVNQVPISASQMVPMLGAVNLAYLAQHVRRQIKDHLACKNAVYHLDVQSVLTNELGVAFEFLSAPITQPLWRYCAPQLVEAVRTQDVVTKINMQEDYFHADIDYLSATKYITQFDAQGPGNDPEQLRHELPIARTMTSILSWFVIIDSALLNQRFLEEMRATHAAKGCPCASPDWAPLFLPHPPPEVCRLFNEFVRCRWPLHIFTLDPETEDQNVGDSFSLRRELQLAMSVAFTSGLMSANNFTRYVRRVELDIDTISINRTIIGFSHGDDTFGWRFYPRVQTPPIDGNLQAFFRDLVVGSYGPRYALRRRRLENGIRECVALIIMPSFVPYLDLDITGNWFRLANPKCKALDLQQTMRLSAAVKTIQDTSPHTSDEHCYRPCDIELMLRRLDQLSHRLPLQKQLVNVPFENTHGGFELLAAGVTNLAPELVGWYGAPGINPNGETALFLVGDNFSVDQTRVIVGGLALDPNCPALCATDRNPATCVCTDAPPPVPSTTMAKTVPPASPAAMPMTVPSPFQLHMPAPLPSIGNPESKTAPSIQTDSDGELAQVVFRRCRRQESRPPAAPIITLLNAPNAGMLPGMQAAAAGAQAATAGAQAALAGVHAAIANGNIGGIAAGTIPAVSGIIRAGGAADPTPTATPLTTPAPTSAGQAATSGALTAVQGAQTATTGALAVAKTESAIATDLTSAGMTLAYNVPHFQMELLSRQVMRVVIPRGVYSNNGYVDVHIATPYGVSPHLAIPILCDTKVVAPTYGYSVDANSKVTINYTLLPNDPNHVNTTYTAFFLGNDNKDSILIDWNSSTGSILSAAKADFSFTFPGTDLDLKLNPISITASTSQGAGKEDGSPKTKDGDFKIEGQKLLGFSTDLFNKLAANKPLTLISALPASLTTKSITITLQGDAQHTTHAVRTSNQLTVQFKLVVPRGALEGADGKQEIKLDLNQKDGNPDVPNLTEQLKKAFRVRVPVFQNNDEIDVEILLEDNVQPISGGLKRRPDDPSLFEWKDPEKVAGELAKRINGDQKPIKSKSIFVTSKKAIFSNLKRIDLSGSLTITPKPAAKLKN